jgi:hypothetical protein
LFAGVSADATMDFRTELREPSHSAAGIPARIAKNTLLVVTLISFISYVAKRKTILPDVPNSRIYIIGNSQVVAKHRAGSCRNTMR